jgi:hypothetical protein
MLLALREEAFRDATLIEHLDGAGVETSSPRPVEVLTGASLDDYDVDARQRQLARQHQPGRTSSGYHHRMLGHRRTPGITPAATVVRTLIRSMKTLRGVLMRGPSRYVVDYSRALDCEHAMVE